jgi:hypothetical protein
LDKKILTLNRKRIYHKLNSNIPKIFGGTENPQAKILAGEFTRKSGHMPVRKLLEKAGGMIKQIKPCFMMSPLSIAQYLDPTNEELQFDVVIFDEASQVKPEDALGAFMRGKTAVVMGDTQQLPPTSFFDQMSDAESDEEEATSLDMESILHLCKLSFPVKMLKWHYRSRHESLITVSNREFYDDDLLVYPSPSHSDPELGLKFRYNPNTEYLRGASSANPLEAQDVVEEIFNHFEKYGDTKSLGVGTFSVAQKNAILEALEVKRKEHPEYEPLFSDNKEERFFVKNLETIQGDERDVILISVGYGYDQDRKMSLNFGPLNQDGGERRLNVLITRAREKCVVFSNFKAYDMNLTANPPYGVKSLKEFLEYAENLTLGTHSVEESSHEPFEDAIASFLEENGYIVHKHIGCAGFRVDLAIVDDENPGKYILGITTDGKMYASSKVARDRDRLREQVLTGLGWKLYHLWSTDWYRNRDLGRKKLLAYVEKSIKESREEERRKSEEEKRLAEKRKLEAEKKAEKLRIAREKEEAERKAKEEAEANEVNIEDIGPSDFVEVEKVDDGDILEKPIDVSKLDPSDLFDDSDDDVKTPDEPINEDYNSQIKEESEFVTVETPEKEEFKIDESEFVTVETHKEEDYPDIEEVETHKEEDFPDIEEVETPKEDDYQDVGDAEPPKADETQETVDEPSEIDEDAEIWESDDGVAPEDNAEVWEDEKDYADDDQEEQPQSVKDRIKSFITPKHDAEDMKGVLFGSLKFQKDISDSPDLEDELKETEEEPAVEEKVDLGSDDDYIYVDHSNDEIVEEPTEEEVPKVKFDKKIEKDVPDEPIVEDHADSTPEEDLKSAVKMDSDKKTESRKKSKVAENTIPDDVPESKSFEDEKVDLGSDDDYIYVDHSNDDEFESDDGLKDEKVDFGSDKEFKSNENLKDEKVDFDSDNEFESDDGLKDEKVDLGSDDDYIYVDHSNDEEFESKDTMKDDDSKDDIKEKVGIDEEKEETAEIVDEKTVRHKPGMGVHAKSIITDFVSGETKLKPREVKTVKGEFMDDEEAPLHKPAPKDDFVVEAEIVNDDDYSDWDDEELNIFNDNLPDWDNDDDDVLNIVDDAKNNYIDETFDDIEIEKDERVFDLGEDEVIEEPESNVENPVPEVEDDEIPDVSQEEAKVEPEDDGVTYYQGSNDVTSMLRKNNFYYDDEKPRSVKESIRGIKKDMKYINKSLKEIENPTQIDYVSVVDRTEEYNPADYLNMPSDDDSDIILEREQEGLTFAEKEERRIEEEMKMEALRKEIESDENVIVTVHEQSRREDLKDQALEDIIFSANEDYKEIEKERRKQDNQLKAFDNHRLPGKKKLEDNIVDYVESADIGLYSADDLYKKPIDTVADSVKQIVDIEGPIHVSEVTKRIRDSCHINRAGANLKKTVNSAIDTAESSGSIIRIGDFLYDASNNNVLIRRRNKPNIELISDEEIAKSIELVLTYNPDISAKQIPKETSRNFGFRSTSKKTAARINSVLDLMIANNKVKIDKDHVELN